MSNGFTRRELIAVAAAAGAAQAQQRPVVEPPKPRATPMIAIYSQQLVKLHYSELGQVVKSLGFEGCDLSVQAGGHVFPERCQADLFRAVESLRGDGVE